MTNKQENTGIFDLSRSDWVYKGIVEGEMDNVAVMGFDMPGYVCEYWGIIYVDEKGDWQSKSRLKFPSGNKQVISKNYGKEANETSILHEIYKLPFRYKNWHRNPCGTADGMFDLMEKNDLILSMTVVKDGDGEE